MGKYVALLWATHGCARSSKEKYISRSSILLHIYVWFYFICREAGGGSITPHVQNFLLETCTGSNVNDLLSCCLTKSTQLIQDRFFFAVEGIYNLFEKEKTNTVLLFKFLLICIFTSYYIYHFIVLMQVERCRDSTYTTIIFKKIISEVELSSNVVIDELYEEFAQRMLSEAVCRFYLYCILIDDNGWHYHKRTYCCMQKFSFLDKTSHIYKEISFLSPTCKLSIRTI